MFKSFAYKIYNLFINELKYQNIIELNLKIEFNSFIKLNLQFWFAQLAQIIFILYIILNNIDEIIIIHFQ